MSASQSLLGGLSLESGLALASVVVSCLYGWKVPRYTENISRAELLKKKLIIIDNILLNIIDPGAVGKYRISPKLTNILHGSQVVCKVFCLTICKILSF